MFSVPFFMTKATTFTWGTSGNDAMLAVNVYGDMLDSLAGHDLLTGLDGADTLVGNAGRDTMVGMGGNDLLDGGVGNDLLLGGAGDDLLRPDSGLVGNDTVDGGDGLDTLDYGALVATRGVRVDLRLTVLQDTLGAGRDLVLNVENVIGTSFSDTINGSSLSNSLIGGMGADKLFGHDGNDLLDGGAGNDSVYGGTGNDFLIGDVGNDFMDGGVGIDTLDYLRANLSTGITLNLGLTMAQNTGGAGTDTVRNIEQVIGSQFNDTITGHALDNWIQGGQGSDTLYGGNGHDALFAGAADLGTTNLLDGGNGNDRLTGGTGADTLLGGAGDDRLYADLGSNVLTGGAGADLFLLRTTGFGLPSLDTITDFNAIEDTLVIQSAYFTGEITFIGNAVFSAAGHTEVRVSESYGMQLVEVDLEGNGAGDVDMTLQVIGSPVTAADLSYHTLFVF